MRAGKVTFVVRNDGSKVHQLVVLRSDRRAARLPLKAGKAVEAGRLGGIGHIRWEPRRSRGERLAT